MPDYQALYNCLASYPGGHAAANADPNAAATWANETVGVTADFIPTTAVWSALMENRDADWRPAGGVTSGGKTISDGDRSDIEKSILGGGRQEIEVAPGAWGRALLIAVFGGSSDVLTQLQADFTTQVPRCSDFGGAVASEDVTEAIRLYGS